MHGSKLALPGFLIQTGRHPAGAEIPRHSHPDPTLCFLLSGRFTEYSRNHTTDCVTGTMKLMPAGEEHWNRFIAPETHGVRIDINRERFVDAPVISALLEEHQVIASIGAGSLMRRLVAELQLHDDASRMVLEGLLLELLGLISRERAVDRREMPLWLRRADEVVHADFATNISLARVASTVGVAPATLARSYRATYQVSIGERVRQLRLDQAARELIEGVEPISIVAANAGFYDQSHFTSAFRRRFAVTPAKFRQIRGKSAKASS